MISKEQWHEAIRSLFAPTFPSCLFCHRKGPASRRYPGLCAACEAALPWIYNPRCRTCGRHVGCPDCSRSPERGALQCNRSAVVYTDSMREMLGQYKYRGNERLAPILGLMLDRAYCLLREDRERGLNKGVASPVFKKRLLSGKNTPSWQADVLVPVPVSDSRLAERGFNQAGQLAEVLCRHRRIPQLPLLVRTQHTGKQSFKSRAERLADMKHAFALSPDPEVMENFGALLRAAQGKARPLRIVIIDDIYTTGSTLRACAETVAGLSVSLGLDLEICSLTWARS